MKILFYDEDTGEMNKFLTDKIIKKFEEMGHEVTTYRFSEDAKKKISMRHFQMYEELLNYADDNNFDLLYHNNYLMVPDFLLAELKVRSNFKPKIVFMLSFREINRSLARTKTYKEIIELPQIHKVRIISDLTKNLTLPSNFIKIFGLKENKKVEIINNIYNEPYEGLIKTRDLSPHKPFTIGYFGRWDYSKGTDIFLNSFEYIDKDIKILVNNIYGNFIFNNEREKRLFKRVQVDKNFYFMGELYKFLEKIDLIICPYRKSYEYAITGSLAVSFGAKKPVIFSDIYPYNEIIKRFKTGLTFIPESPRSLAIAINYAKHNYEKLKAEANFKDGSKDYLDVESIAASAI